MEIDLDEMKTGETASPARAIIDLVNAQRLYINAELSESFIKSVHQGDTALVSFPDLPGVVKPVPVSFVSEVINPLSRTFSLRIEMDNPNGQIKPNMLANIKLKVFEHKNALTLPTILIRHDLQGAFVYTVQTTGNLSRAVKRYITTGKSDGEVSMIVSGLEPGELVITEGYNQVREGSRIILSK
jgi:RND family efflux transporter MFP subunit